VQHNRKSYIFFVGLPILLLCGIVYATFNSVNVPLKASYRSEHDIFEARNQITLDFELSKPVSTTLFLESSYGNTVLESDNGSFALPVFISRKRGKLKYTLLHNKKVLLTGDIEIIPNRKTPVVLESYIGPPSILAGGHDYTMQSVIPTDSYDNPLPDSTAIQVQHQFLDLERYKTIYTKDLLGWIRIFSYPKSGRILLSSKVEETTSKEFSVEVYPWLPVDFEITSSRKHNYADGNQITHFTTSILRDQYGNIVSDGTLVDAYIYPKNGTVLRTQGKTVNGQALLKMLHPDHAETWRIKAFVEGIAESNTLTLDYVSVIDDFDVSFHQKKRRIRVGPLFSFMGQLIPDGAVVTLKIFRQGQKIETKVKTSFEGKVEFWLDKDFYPNGKYTVVVNAMGIQKEFKDMQLQ